MPTLEYRGIFGVPDVQRQVAGTIVRDTETGRTVLELDERFDLRASPFEFSSYDVFHGTLIDGSFVTLLGCSHIRIGSATSPDRTAAESYSCSHWIAGSCVRPDETYQHIRFSLTDLVSWSAFRPFETHTDHSADGPVFSIRSIPPIRHAAQTARGKVEFQVWPSVTSSSGRASITAQARIRITPLEPIPLQEVLRLYGRPLQDLVTIATDRPQEIVDLQVVRARNQSVEEPSGDLDWCTVHSARWALARLATEEPDRHTMLFSLADLTATLESSLDNWFALDDQVHEVRTLATGITYRKDMFADQRFIYAAHAAETYHRRRVGGAERGREAHRKLVKEIIEATPKEHRSWLKEKLAFSNELSLATRLEQLRARSCTAVNTSISRIPNWERWVRDTRNYYTHYTARKRTTTVARGARMHALTESLLLVVEDMMLRELGLSDMARNMLIGKSRRARSLLHWSTALSWDAS